MSLPGYELLRVTITRIGDKKHPFSPDRQHLHHYLVSKLSVHQSFLIDNSNTDSLSRISDNT